MYRRLINRCPHANYKIKCKSIQDLFLKVSQVYSSIDHPLIALLSVQWQCHERVSSKIPVMSPVSPEAHSACMYV